LAEANRLAGELGVTANQIALAWLLHQDVKIIPLLGTANLEHLHDAIEAAKISLKRPAWESLARVRAPGR
jgi:aryl-alcohol dehydrogenase-like predicted oxidoreductase